ncbi:MAG: hypothetical protein IKE65_05585 [Clostridia bacterium]|nr:hypothetical protein [Clostridia bacterium]
MDHINIYAVGGDTVILSGGVLLDEMQQNAKEIIKNEPLSVQAGFIVSTEIKIPRCACAADFFSADCALCFGAYLSEKRDEKSAFLISSTGADTPISACINEAEKTGTLAFAGKAKEVPSGSVKSVVFGGCEYFILEKEEPEKPQQLLDRLSESSALGATALLLKNDKQIHAYFRQKEDICCGFSAGSAAIALAFYESASEREYFKGVYHFPKGDREVEMKRFLSEAFEVKLSASVEKRG